MQNIKKYLIWMLMIIVFLVPTSLLAQTMTSPINKEIEERKAGLIQCGRDIYNFDVTDESGKKIHFKGEVVPCRFDDVIHLIDKIIGYLLVLAVSISAIMFVYAGFTLVTSGGSTSARTKAKDIFLSALIGLVLAFAAFLIIKFLLSMVGYESAGLFGF